MSSGPVQPSSTIRVDVTLVDAMIALTPEERLRQNDRMIETVRELRHAAELAPGGTRRVASSTRVR